MASSQTSLAARLAAVLAMAVSSAGGVPPGPASRTARPNSNRAPSTATAMSASFHCSPCSAAIGLPPTTRSFMYRTECSNAPWAAPTHMAALPHRSWLRWARRTLNASVEAGSPANSTSSSVTATSSKAISDSVAAWIPMPR